ncbi:F0F1 ATP synthase subunit gamma [Candidatus Gromoviella agglomerans]|uniref:F0F1 ATP synthase subunit gamma n=1 Tax=Candidatus Gromoviella agglomerans TaxID=2806609 RepID=UPI001E5628C7|nr:F0F1 ATP synthase subunit gamma [Candidatus Gromoviella agglomerans]
MKISNLKSRLNVIKSINKISNAMKSIAIAKMKICQSELQNTSAYYAALIAVYSKVYGNKISSIYDMSKVLENYAINSQDLIKVLVVFSADNGLCGSFFSNCLSTLEKINFKEYDRIYIFGEKMRYIDYVKDFVKSSHDLNDVISEIIDLNAKITLIYNRFHSVSVRIFVNETINTSLMQKDPPINRAYFNDISRECNNYLSRELLFTHIKYSYMTNAVSEHSARFYLMDNASNKANDLESELLIEYNELRQSKITMELLDIVSGTYSAND